MTPEHIRKTSSEPGRVSVYVSISIICLLIFLILPWQIAFLGCWIIHLYTCATSQVKIDDDGTESSSPGDLDGPPAYIKPMTNDERNHNMLVLLWMTWLLPLVAPVLVVWVRTLMTAGLTAHFDGDHNPAHVISFVILVELLSSRRLKVASHTYVDHDLFQCSKGPDISTNSRRSTERSVAVGCFILLASMAFVLLPCVPFRLFDGSALAVAFIVATRLLLAPR